MPDLIIFNANIYSHTPATAIAIKKGKISAMGNNADMLALAHKNTRTIDARGNRLLPGITDAHIHFYHWAESRQAVNLAGCDSLDELLHRLKERVGVSTAGVWIKGHAWNESEWTPPKMPTRFDLDKISPQNPMLIWRADHHAAVANSAALRAAGISANFPDPTDGVIERDSHGEPTGILKELAIDLVGKLIPTLSNLESRQAMIDGIPELHRLGITGIHDQRMMSGAEGATAWQAYQDLEAAGQLNLRMTANIHYSQLPNAIALGLKSGFGSDRLRFGFVKMFSDGSMGAHTAWVLHSYVDEANTFGMAAMPMQTIAEVTRQASAHGWSVSVHAIGDRANREVLDIMAETLATSPILAFPHRIEHAQLLAPSDVTRFGKLGITASMQPIHLLDDIVKMDRVWGSRSQNAFVFKQLLESSAHLAFGSDAPVADPNPWLGIHAAVNRRKPNGYPEDGYFPAERLSVAQAVDAYTIENARAVGLENRQGSVEVGKWADLVLIDQDIFSIDPMKIADTKVLLTIFDGEAVFRADGWGS